MKNHIAIAISISASPAILPLKITVPQLSGQRRKTTRNHLGLDADSYLDVLRPRFGDFLGDIRLAEAFRVPSGDEHR